MIILEHISLSAALLHEIKHPIWTLQAAVTDIQVVSHGFLTCGGDGSVKLIQLRDCTRSTWKSWSPGPSKLTQPFYSMNSAETRNSRNKPAAQGWCQLLLHLNMVINLIWLVHQCSLSWPFLSKLLTIIALKGLKKIKNQTLVNYHKEAKENYKSYYSVIYAIVSSDKSFCR